MLTIVTVCFNNPSELEKTVQSVRGQSVSPDSYLVIDSSDSSTKPAMQALAKSASAKYVWVEPEGVYAAMRHSLTLVNDDSWVWWVNASDWLAGKRSVEIVKKEISSASLSDNTHWMVGELLRVRIGAPSTHPLGLNGAEFIQSLTSGRIGFPHPSTIFRASALKTVAPYTDSFRIASDYALALRFAKHFGPPKLIPASLTFHDPTGLTSRHPVRHTWEKSRARVSAGSFLDGTKELWRLPVSGVRGALSRIVGEKPVIDDHTRHPHYPLRGNEPFD